MSTKYTDRHSRELRGFSDGMILPADPDDRKSTPMCTGMLDYFPLAFAEAARLSKAGNDQHNPGLPLHWAREKSNDHADCILRHLVDRGTRDTDGVRHSTKLFWRAAALLQCELEAERAALKGDGRIDDDQVAYREFEVIKYSETGGVPVAIIGGQNLK
jgi:hypothetical protein